MMNERKKILADELHVPARRKFPTRKVIMRGIDETWQADLIDMQSYSKLNQGHHFLLTVIDNVSKFAWVSPLKRKTGVELKAALTKIFQQGRFPKNLHVDKGSEFYNKNVKALLKSYNINLYSTYSDKKASICERFNRTLKTKMWKMFSMQGSHKWIDILPDLVNDYNNSVHRSIKMKPNKVTADDEERLVKLLNKSSFKVKKPKFKVGDHVRISRLKPIFEKGYTPNWTPEIFTVTKVQKTKPITYKLMDYRKEPIEGGFYEFEMLKVKNPDIYLIDEILKRKGNKFYVKWLGFDNTHNSWIDKSDL